MPVESQHTRVDWPRVSPNIPVDWPARVESHAHIRACCGFVSPMQASWKSSWSGLLILRHAQRRFNARRPGATIATVAGVVVPQEQ